MNDPVAALAERIARVITPYLLLPDPATGTRQQQALFRATTYLTNPPPTAHNGQDGGTAGPQDESGDGGDDPPSLDEPSWLPPGFTFLSGLPSVAARQRRRIVAIQAFVDDSGAKGQGRVFIFASVSTSARQWAAFSVQWAEALAAAPSIRYFKAREAASRKDGEFAGWSEAKRDDKLRALIRVVNQFRFQMLPFGVDLPGFSQTLGAWDKPLNQPYFWAYQILIFTVAHDLYEMGLREPFEMIFDEQVIFGPRAHVWYPLAKRILGLYRPELAAIMPTDPLFQNDETTMPLQLADLFAWMTRRDVAEETNPLGWIRTEFRTVNTSPNQTLLDEPFMRLMMTNMTHPDAVPDEIVRLYRQLFE